MKKLTRLFLAGSLFFSGNVFALDGVETLRAFFKDLKTLNAEFNQSVLNAQLSVTDLSSGTLYIDRPGQFRWDYKSPYEQEIVSNGKKVWIFDKDLEQVTVKPFDATMGNTPALLLSSNEALENGFLMRNMNQANGMQWVELVPKDADAGFTGIQLGFEKGELRQMHLSDNLGQTTQLVFSKVKRNLSLDNNLFQFNVPAGADVFDTTVSQ